MMCGCNGYARDCNREVKWVSASGVAVVLIIIKVVVPKQHCYSLDTRYELIATSTPSELLRDCFLGVVFRNLQKGVSAHR